MEFRYLSTPLQCSHASADDFVNVFADERLLNIGGNNNIQLSRNVGLSFFNLNSNADGHDPAPSLWFKYPEPESEIDRVNALNRSIQ